MAEHDRRRFGRRLTPVEGYELSPHDGEQEAIREIKRLGAEGLARRPIAEAMRAKGHKISHEGVAGVLRADRDA
jgi:hypothetical protein